MLSSRPIQLNTDGAYLPAKTPSRGLKNRIENAHAGGGGTMSVNGKGGKNASAFPKTPFQPSTIKPTTGKQRILLTTTRPLGDKTPLPNRFAGNVLFQTPLPGMAKLSKLNQSEGGTPDSAQRPSSMRKHTKHPRNSGGKAFETPANRGNHWDVSDGDIVIPEVQPETIVEDEGDDMDEVEYGPPNTLDLPYEPPFDFALPDYKEVGRTLFQLAHSCRYDDTPAPVKPEFKEAELETPNWDMMPLPPIESDDPFYLARLESLALPPKVKAAIARPKALQPGTTRTAAVRPSTTQPSTTKAAAPRTVSGRPASRAAPSTTTAASQKGSAVPSVRSTTRSQSAASVRLASRAATTQPSAVVTKSKAAPATSALKRLPSTRGASSANTTAHPGAKPASNTSQVRKAVETRRPHTALAVGTAAKAKGNGKAGAVGDVDEGIVFEVGFGMEDELDFRFDV